MIIHATTVAVEGAGLLIRGPSGTGKSSLAIQMLALGAWLVADDRTRLWRPDDGPPMAEAPCTISGLVEARGLGVIQTAAAGPTRLSAVLEMSAAETQRLPEPRTTEILGFALPVVYRVDGAAFPSALMLWLRALAKQ